MTITPADLHARFSALPGAALDHPFGEDVEVYKVAGKVFGWFVARGDHLHVTLKGDPVLNEILREQHPAIHPGYHTDKRHWNTLHLEEGLPEALVWDLLQSSYGLVRSRLPKKVRDSL